MECGLYIAGSLLHLSAPMNIAINLLLVVHVVICLILALLVLMQRPKNEGLGAAFGSGMTDSVWGAQTTDILQKGTKVFGTLFFVVTLVLAILMSSKHGGPSVASESDLETAPAIIDAPAEELLDEAETTEETPAEPAEEPAPVETPAEPIEEPAPVETPAPTDTPAPQQ